MQQAVLAGPAVTALKQDQPVVMDGRPFDIEFGELPGCRDIEFCQLHLMDSGWFAAGIEPDQRCAGAARGGAGRDSQQLRIAVRQGQECERFQVGLAAFAVPLVQRQFALKDTEPPARSGAFTGKHPQMQLVVGHDVYVRPGHGESARGRNKRTPPGRHRLGQIEQTKADRVHDAGRVTPSINATTSLGIEVNRIS